MPKSNIMWLGGRYSKIDPPGLSLHSMCPRLSNTPTPHPHPNPFFFPFFPSLTPTSNPQASNLNFSYVKNIDVIYLVRLCPVKCELSKYKLTLSVYVILLVFLWSTRNTYMIYIYIYI